MSGMYVSYVCMQTCLLALVGEVLLQDILYIAKGIQPCHTETLGIDSIYEGP